MPAISGLSDVEGKSTPETQSEIDTLYLQAAYELAYRGLCTVTRNNPRVGCLLVNNHQVIGRGWHAKDGGAHAEVNAIASSTGTLQGSTAYVTLEPCSFDGRTGACTSALVRAGVRRVVVGALDPHPNVRGSGVASLRARGVEVDVVDSEQNDVLNCGQISRHKKGRPFVRIKCGMTLDGRTATSTGESKWITSKEARRDVQSWRARSGAILTGIGTVLADDPRLTVRDKRFPASDPWRVVLDSTGRTPANATLFSVPNKILVFSANDSQSMPAIENLKHIRLDSTRVDIEEVLRQLGEMGVNELLVEAGATLVGEFLRLALWDEIVLYTAPKFLGSQAKPVAVVEIPTLARSVEMRIESVDTIGSDLRIIGRPV